MENVKKDVAEEAKKTRDCFRSHCRIKVKLQVLFLKQRNRTYFIVVVFLLGGILEGDSFL